LVEPQAESNQIPMQVVSQCLVASIQLHAAAELPRSFQHDLLDRIKRTGVSGVILDVSGVQIMDVEDFELLRRSMAMASILGARSILVGLQPGIVSSLIALDCDVDGVEAAADLDDAFRRLRPVAEAKDDATAAEDDATTPPDQAG
jgi:rsbT antagonist protein RsbS